MSTSADIAMLERLTQAAFDFATAFAGMAQAEDDLDRKLTLFDAFHRSSSSVRLSIALKMRLEREARTPARPEREHPERLEQPDRPERPERFDERDRERDAERVSLPILLRTLERVADDAEALLPQPAELPTLRELLARVKAQPIATPAPLRARLSGGTAAAVLTHPHGVIPVSPPGEDRDPTFRRSASSGAPPRPGPPSHPRSTSRLGPGLGLPPKPG